MKMMGWICALALLGFAACDNDDDDKNNLERPDERFVEKTALGNMTEVDFGNLAANKGESQMVRTFGQKMVTEHTTAQQELQSIANNFGNVNWPEQLDPQHQQVRQQLSAMSGRAFDSAYMASQVMDHQMTLQIFENELDSGRDATVKAYAEKYHHHIQEHYQEAQNILSTILSGADGN